MKKDIKQTEIAVAFCYKLDCSSQTVLYCLSLGGFPVTVWHSTHLKQMNIWCDWICMGEVNYSCLQLANERPCILMLPPVESQSPLSYLSHRHLQQWCCCCQTIPRG